MGGLDINNVILDTLKKYNVKLNKNLGQNFLIDSNITKKIVDCADVTKEDIVIEVGPGIGSMTVELADRAEKVYAVEIDKNIIEPLKEVTAEYDNVEIINQDILKTDLKKEFDFGERKIKVVANLPYYITTPIIMKFLKEDINISKMVFMVQKEVAERIVSGPGSKNYGALSVEVQYYAEAKKMFDVSPNCFVPRPDVTSSVILLDVLDDAAINVENKELFFDVVKASFGQRRKTLLNSLYNSNIIKGASKEDIKELLQSVGIEEGTRGERLTIEQFGQLTDKINEKVSIF